jgi:hypothetical protein
MNSYADKRANKYMVDKYGIGNPDYNFLNNDRDIVSVHKRDWFEKFLDFITSITKIARFICIFAFIIIKIIYIFAFIYIKLCGNTIE